MTLNAQQWKTRLKEARAEEPTLINASALTVFPALDTPGMTVQIAAATAVRNLLSYAIALSIQNYSNLDSEELPEKTAIYLDDLQQWLLEQNNAVLFIGAKRLAVQTDMIESVYESAAKYPEPPAECIERIFQAWQMCRKLLALKDTDDTECLRQLYSLSSLWHKSLSRQQMQLFPVSKPFEFAEKHVARHLNRIDYHTARSLVWGKEFHDLIQKYLDLGFCQRTASAKARKEFIANHPYPVTDNELLNDEAIPGHSRPAMLRYLKMYRESIANPKEQ